ncbi:hypothetical protein [Bradyrhizobium sp.]|nr:hypothetical protein [Bradyrhizobium sp.]
MTVTEFGFLCPISVRSAKQRVNQPGENWLNIHPKANRPLELLAIVNTR